MANSKQLLGATFSLATIKTKDQGNVEVFLRNKRKIAITPTVHYTSAVSKALLGESSNH